MDQDAITTFLNNRVHLVQVTTLLAQSVEGARIKLQLVDEAVQIAAIELLNKTQIIETHAARHCIDFASAAVGLWREIAEKRLRDRVRQERRRNGNQSFHSLDAALEPVAPPLDDPVRTAMNNELSVKVKEALLQLNARHQDEIRMRFFEEKNFREIGEVMEIKRQTAERNTARTVNLLRSLMEK